MLNSKDDWILLYNSRVLKSYSIKN